MDMEWVYCSLLEGLHWVEEMDSEGIQKRKRERQYEIMKKQHPPNEKWGKSHGKERTNLRVNICIF